MPESERMPAVLLLLGSTALLGGALGFQYLGGLHPCVLCLYQRVPHAAVIILALVAIVAAGRPQWARWSTAVAGLALLAGAGVAGFHVGVEQLWWQGTAGCSAQTTPDTVEELRKQLMERRGFGCDVAPWSLFGLSMAGYNFVFSLAMAAYALWRVRPAARTGAVA